MSSLFDDRLKVSISSIAYATLYLSVALRLLLGNKILDIFYPYTAEGGSPLLKIHPGTWLLLAGTLLYGFCRGYGKIVFHVFNYHKPVGFALVTTVVLMFYTVILWGIGGAAYLVDTYLFACVALILATQLNYQQCLKLFKLIAIIVVLNGMIAIYEYLTRTHLTPNAVTWITFFRANALMGHPLNNALITIAVALSVFIGPFSNLWRYSMIGLAFLAILAFATRASLVMFVVAVVFIVWSYSLTAKMEARKRKLWLVAGPVVAGFCFIIFYIIVFFTSIGQGIAGRASLDGSAMARIDAIEFFTGLPVGRYFFGVGSQEFSALVDRYSSVAIIENFWIQLVVTFGIPMFLILLLSYGKLIKWVVGRTDLQAYILVASWLVAASTNNSLSVKTSALAVFLLTLYLLSRVRGRQH